MKHYVPFLSFTIITLLITGFQTFYLKSEINKYKNDNIILRKKIELGYKKHLQILNEKELEKNAAIANVQYSYSVNKPEVLESEEYKDGYLEGYHNGIKDGIK
jgi:hypothetical protein